MVVTYYAFSLPYRALKAGHRKPILIVPNEYSFPNAFIVTILGALEALYVVSTFLFFPFSCTC